VDCSGCRALREEQTRQAEVSRVINDVDNLTQSKRQQSRNEESP
jgi:hypothetical protein